MLMLNTTRWNTPSASTLHWWTTARWCWPPKTIASTSIATYKFHPSASKWNIQERKEGGKRKEEEGEKQAEHISKGWKTDPPVHRTIYWMHLLLLLLLLKPGLGSKKVFRHLAKVLWLWERPLQNFVWTCPHKKWFPHFVSFQSGTTAMDGKSRSSWFWSLTKIYSMCI